MPARTLTVALILLASACARPASLAPSLTPRAAEAIDPRVPIPSEPVVGPVDPALRARLDALVAAAGSGQQAFEPTIRTAEQLAAAAGPSGSESWIAAQQALSVAVSAREGTARALADVDALMAAATQSRGGLPPGDRIAAEEAARRIGAIEAAQARRIAAVQARLAG